MSAPDGFNAALLLSAPWRSFRRTVVTVTTTATPLPTTPLENRKGLYLWHPGTTTVWLGPSDVGTSNEARLFGGQLIPIPVSDDVTLYGRVATGTQAVVVWEFIG